MRNEATSLPGRISASAEKHPLATIGLFILLALGPFLNKAVHIDDSLFVWTAEQILKHPADFFGFDVNWYGSADSMASVDCNPPTFSYLLAGVMALFGEREMFLHAAMMLVAFGAAAGISEMLVQSQSGSIHILPALPAVWPEGQVRGLRARGDVTLDIVWSAGKAREITLYTSHAGRLSIRSTVFSGRFSVVDLASGRKVPVAGTGMRRTINVKRGKRYVLTAVS